MKKNTFLSVAVFAAFFTFGCEKEEVVKDTELPQPAKEFISTHFASATITTVVKEEELKKVSYDVVLNNGTTLDFNKAGECTEIDSNKAEKLPDSVIPVRILEYVQTNYASDFITGWEIDGADQDIELSSQLELKFDKDSNFLRVED
jgi:hypothetical protein